jgi:tartronate-semialdehyde synthase
MPENGTIFRIFYSKEIRMNVSEVIVKILEKEGIETAFGIPGAGINGLYKYLEKARIAHYLMRHEEAAVHGADGFLLFLF